MIDPNTIDQSDAPGIAWLRVSDALALLWADNPKLHDIGAVATSIARYGFQELPKYDAVMKAIKAGNGRIEALAWMEKQGQPLPRGLAQLDDGAWVVPVLVGVDAASPDEALAYAIDSNNLVLLGGDIDFSDMMHIWDQDKFTEIVLSLAHALLPVSVSEQEVAALVAGPMPEAEEEASSSEAKIIICPECGAEFPP